MKMKRKPVHYWTAALLAALVLTSCGGEGDGGAGAEVEEQASSASMEGTSWELTGMIVLGGHVFTPDDPARYTLQFRSDNRLTGQSDCNRFTANWNRQEGLSISDFSTTRSMCLAGSLHNFYTLYLRNANALERDGATMILRTPDEEVRLIFREAV